MTPGSSSSSVESSAKGSSEKASTLSFNNLFVSIPSKLAADADSKNSQQKKKAASLWRHCGLTPGAGTKPILDGVSGTLRGGELTAILGPSGAGKTTLFDALMGRAHGRGGKVFLDGRPFDESLRDLTAYVTQDDTLFPFLTVRENLTFAAAVKMPSCDPWAEKQRRIEEVLEELSLGEVANSLIGGVSNRGVSGGERRRVSIGAGIVHRPSVILLDEPLSGLDSAHAFKVASHLRTMARAGAIVAMTVHQPSLRISSMFDHILVLAHGQVMFAGALGDIPGRISALRSPETAAISGDLTESKSALESPDSAVPYGNFIEEYLELLLDKALEAPGGSPGAVPGEKAVSQPALGEAAPADSEAKESENGSAGREMAAGTGAAGNTDQGDGIPLAAPRRISAYANGHVREVVLLVWRNQLIQLRTPELFAVRLMLVTGIGILVATLFKDLSPTPEGLRSTFSFVATCLAVAYFESNNALPHVIEERVIVGKETFQKLYRVSSYVIANTVSGIPMSAVLALIYTLEVWWIVGLLGGAPAFMYTWLILFLCFTVGGSFASLAASLVPSFTIGVSLVITVSFGLFLVSGYFQNGNALPSYWLWLHYLSL
ncbi:ABC transporter G family [Klebsormidium nitens]|uniref:ABC transporter G family n=1 Tax=Klebsormidium nitens TaxID=105231 RepID=A0A1Y1I1H8_KLENI|nr:ABC transporter G family [Klebsormidium nitens]|eukprot:GAQ83812.1 ABC transporter G family [Klebsormidium nitens]